MTDKPDSREQRHALHAKAGQRLEDATTNVGRERLHLFASIAASLLSIALSLDRLERRGIDTWPHE